MTKKKKAVVITSSVVGAILALLIIAVFVIAHFMVNLAIGRGGFLAKIDYEFDGDLNFDNSESKAWWDEQDSEEIRIVSHDGLSLVAYHLPYQDEQDPTATSKKVALIAHGYSSSGLHMTTYARMFNQFGYNVLMPDDRGHGESEGDWIGMGWLDQPDYLQWIDKLIEIYGNDCEIVLHGVSMGGATVAALSGQENLPDNVKCVIEDCGYDSVKSIFQFQLKDIFHLPSFPIINIASMLANGRAGYSFWDADMAAMVAQSKVPILFIHGDDDKFVPTEMVYTLYNAAKGNGQDRDLWLVKDAGHGMAHSKATEEYEARTLEWLRKHVPLEQAA